jgi:hypothetical protein
MLKKIDKQIIIIFLIIVLSAGSLDIAVNITNSFLSKEYVAIRAIKNIEFLNYLGVVSFYMIPTYIFFPFNQSHISKIS